jgi:hypothetical protein
LIAGLLALGVGIPVLAGLIGGTLQIPRLDDWVYRRVALELNDSGVLDLHNVTTMMIGQVFVAQPYLWLAGSGPWAFAAAGITFAALAVLSCYFLGRQFLPASDSALVTALLLVFPGYLAYAVSFMTDVPTLAFEFGCLGCGAIGLRSRPTSLRWLAVAATIGCVGFSFREFAIAAPACLVLAALIAEPRRLGHWILAAAVSGFCLALYVVKAALAGPNLGHIPGGGAISQSMYALSSISLVLLPIALLGAYRIRGSLRRLDVSIGAEIGLLVVAVRVFQAVTSGAMPAVILGDLASQWGVPAPGVAVGDRPALFSPLLWGFVGLVALAATVVVPATVVGMAGVVIRRQRSIGSAVRRLGTPAGLLVMFVAAIVAGMAVYGLNFPIFDRYYWAIVPVLGILLLREPLRDTRARATGPRTPRRIVIPASAALVLLAVVSLIFVLNSAAFDGARWQAGQQLAELGIAPETIDAGYEWVGLFQPDLPAANDLVSRKTFYEHFWPGRRQCGIVSSSGDRPAGAADAGSTSYLLFLFWGPREPLYLSRLNEPNCLST